MGYKFAVGDKVFVRPEGAHATVTGVQDAKGMRGYLVRLPAGQFWVQEADLSADSDAQE